MFGAFAGALEAADVAEALAGRDRRIEELTKKLKELEAAGHAGRPA